MKIPDENGECVLSVSTLPVDKIYAQLLLYPNVDIPMSAIPANCSDCLNFVAVMSLGDEITINQVRLNSKMISNTWYVNTFAISVNYLEKGLSMGEVIENIGGIIQNGLAFTTHNQSIHLRAEFAKDILNDQLYPHVVKYNFSDILVPISRITENYFCRQVDLQENEIAWVPGESGTILFTDFNTPFRSENYVLIRESGKLLKTNQFIILNERQNRIRACIEHTNFSVFQQRDVSSRGFICTYVPLFILLLSAVIVNIFKL